MKFNAEMTAGRLRDALLPWAVPLRAPISGDWLSSDEHPLEYGQSLTEFTDATTKPRSFDSTANNRVKVCFVEPLEADVLAKVADPLRSLLETYFPGIAVDFEQLPPEKREGLESRKTPSGTKQLYTGGDGDEPGSLRRVASELRGSYQSCFAVVLLTREDLYSEADDADDWLYGHTLMEGGGLCASWNRCAVGNPTALAVNRKFLTVLLHEIGHVFYLGHCVSFDCLMNGFNHDAELQVQSVLLCPECHAKLFAISRFDPVKRFRSLRQKFEELFWRREASIVANLASRVQER